MPIRRLAPIVSVHNRSILVLFSTVSRYEQDLNRHRWYVVPLLVYLPSMTKYLYIQWLTQQPSYLSWALLLLHLPFMHPHDFFCRTVYWTSSTLSSLQRPVYSVIESAEGHCSLPRPSVCTPIPTFSQRTFWHVFRYVCVLDLADSVLRFVFGTWKHCCRTYIHCDDMWVNIFHVILYTNWPISSPLLRIL